jgi:hypothetical protein
MSSSASNSSFIDATAASMRETSRLRSAGFGLQLGNEKIEGVERLA